MGIAISTHLPPPVMIDNTASRECVTHILCWTWAICFSAAASSEKDQGSMNLASKIAPVPSTTPSRVAAIQGMTKCSTRRWTSPTVRPVLRSYQLRLRSSVTLPSCTVRLPERSSGPTSPRFSRQRRTRAASSLPIIILASEPPMNARRRVQFLLFSCIGSSLPYKNYVSIYNLYPESQDISYRIVGITRLEEHPFRHD